MNCCGVLFFMWLYSNFQESVMTVMLTHGWPLSMFPGFESPRNRFWLNGIISQSVRLSPCEQDPEEEEEEGVRSFRLQKSRPCAQSSVAVRITTPPRFSSPLCTDAVAAAAPSTTSSPSPPHPVPCDRSTGDSGIIANKRFGTGGSSNGAFNRSLTTDTLLER
jgi:hypothetical protein